MTTAADIHAWPMATDANAAQRRVDRGIGTYADKECLLAFDRKVRKMGGKIELAFDAATPGRRGGRGDEGEVGDPTALMSFLREHLQPDDYGQAELLLQEILYPGAAVDEPPAFPGRPRPGGGMDPLRSANDAAAALGRVKSGIVTKRDALTLALHAERQMRTEAAAAAFDKRWGKDAQRIRQY